jgi:putative ABC transport system substrate-binding protein
MKMQFGLMLLTAVGASLPVSVAAQPAARLPTVAILSDGGPTSCASLARGYPAACMVDELRALGHVEGRNVAFAYRYAQTDYARLPALAAELVGLRPDVVYTLTGAGAEAAAKATTTIPIVVGPAGEIILARLAGNLARPTRNVTGQTLDTGQQSMKCLQLLKEMAPRTSRVAVIYNPDNPALVAGALGEMGRAAAQLGLALVRVHARGVAELPKAFAAVAASGADAIMMFDEGALAASGEVRKLVSDWALNHRMPVASANIQFAADGALVSLGTDVAAVARRAAFYVHRILEGAKPGDLPVERPTVFKLSVNRKTAATLGLTIPDGVLLRADEVIQ